MPNGYLINADMTISMNLTSVLTGKHLVTVKSQLRQGFAFSAIRQVPEKITVSGVCRSVEDYEGLIKALRKHQQSLAFGNLTPLKFSYPAKNWNYAVAVVSIPAGGKRFDYAPEYSLTFLILNDYTSGDVKPSDWIIPPSTVAEIIASQGDAAFGTYKPPVSTSEVPNTSTHTPNNGPLYVPPISDWIK